MTTLCLYTASFPYGLGEQFIETEIKYLVQTFQRVVIIPSLVTGKQRALPPGVEVLQPSFEGYTTTKGLFSLGRWFYHCLFEELKHPHKKLMISSLLRIGYKTKVLHQFLKQHEMLTNTVHYTYWLDEQSTILSALKSKDLIKGYISRAHGFDLYYERRKEGFIPFRNFQLKQISRLYLISQNGLDYMGAKFPQYRHKYKLSYLGIENNLPFQYTTPTDGPYLMVSCSRVVDIKRIDLIVKALSQINDLNIHWVHFGDGPLLEDIKNEAKLTLPKNVKCEFKGHVDNQTIYNFYTKNDIALFINVSSSEGLPVTLMEAISFGIPIIATNVGGSAEITNSQTGTLLQENPSISEIKNGILSLIKQNGENPELKKQAYKFWVENFNATQNYSKFAQEITKINERNN
jgi:glycosyltransferase involved in cell wall biosynthesis